MPKSGIPDDKIAVIVAAIKARPATSPTTWEDIRGIAAETLGKKLTRQMLDQYQDIKTAYGDQSVAYKRNKKKISRPATKPGDPKDRRISNLEAQLQEAKNIINSYDQRFILILHNTRRLGFQREELDRPLSQTSKN